MIMFYTFFTLTSTATKTALNHNLVHQVLNRIEYMYTDRFLLNLWEEKKTYKLFNNAF